MTIFGKVPTYQGTEKYDLAISPDRQALTLTFNDFGALIRGKAAVPVASRLFNFVLPLEGKEDHAEVGFTLQGTQLVEKGASATLVCSVNGQTIAADFAPDMDFSFERRLKFVTDNPAECRLSILLLLGRDAESPDAECQINMTAVDAAILPAAGQRRG